MLHVARVRHFVRIARASTRLVSASVLALCMAQSASAQTPAPNVALSWGVDTTITAVSDIVQLMRAYLARPDSTARIRGLWSTKNRFDAQHGDLATEAYQGFPATILGITGIGVGDSVFIVKVLHANSDNTQQRVRPLALQRFYAVRAAGSTYGWQLASPLPRLTREWRRWDEGRLTLWYAPGQRHSPQKARQASQFVDSVARVFGVAPPQHLDVYMTATMDEGAKLLGLDFFVEESGPGTGLGGRGGGAGILLLSNPAIGEAYFHEFVHAVLVPSIPSRNSLFVEGVAVWLGGSEGRSLKELCALLYEYQRVHPTVTVSDILTGEAPGGHDATIALYATRGLIADAIFQRQGVQGLRKFANEEGAPIDILKVLPKYIDGIDADSDRWWHSEVANRRNH
ncbi:MAG: hypothetical protein ABIT38_02380 [Gemmatimonadaceae bacterium]